MGSTHTCTLSSLSHDLLERIAYRVAAFELLDWCSQEFSPGPESRVNQNLPCFTLARYSKRLRSIVSSAFYASVSIEEPSASSRKTREALADPIWVASPRAQKVCRTRWVFLRRSIPPRRTARDVCCDQDPKLHLGKCWNAQPKPYMVAARRFI